jgi:hypothetical protein
MLKLLIVVFFFVTIFGLIGLIYPTPWHKKVKLSKRWINAVLCFVFLILAGFIADLDKNQTNKDALEIKLDSKPLIWQNEVKTIATSNKTKTEKFDEVMILAKNYQIVGNEQSEFETYIKHEFISGNYLKDIKNDEYMLSNIFKSEVINRHYDDKLQVPIDQFAFDFLQNTKYTYRGVDTVDSSAVRSNERQMNKSLKKMK